jgi:trigger factor
MSSRRPAALLLAIAFGLGAGCSRPNVTYKGLKISRPVPSPVTAKDVTLFLDQARNSVAQPVPLPPDTTLKSGHRAIIDFQGTIGGTPFTGGSGTAFPVVLGSGQMIPGFESGIIGMRPGQSKRIPVTFPADYHETSLAGKAAEFLITVRAAESLRKPPLDAEFARQVTGGRISSVAELRTAAQAQLTQQRAQQAEGAVRQQVAEALLAQWAKEPSARDVDKELDKVVQQQLQAAAQRGMGAAQGGPDAEALRAQHRPMVARAVRLSKVLAWIAKRENIGVTDGEVEQYARQMAAQQGQAPDAFLAMLKQQDHFESLRRRMLEDRVMTLILQHAVMEEPRRLPGVPPAR